MGRYLLRWLLFVMYHLSWSLLPSVPAGLAFPQACAIALGLGFAFHHPRDSLSPSPVCLKLISPFSLSLFYVGVLPEVTLTKAHGKKKF